VDQAASREIPADQLQAPSVALHKSEGQRWRGGGEAEGAVAGREAEGRKATVEGRRGQGRTGRGCAAGCREPSSRRRPLLFPPYSQVSSLCFPPKLHRLQALLVAGLYFPRRPRFPLDFPTLGLFPLASPLSRLGPHVWRPPHPIGRPGDAYGRLDDAFGARRTPYAVDQGEADAQAANHALSPRRRLGDA